MDGATVGLIGGIAGGALGVCGGLVGAYFSIRNTNGPRERAFMVKTALIAWVAIFVFIAFLLLIPQPWNWLMWIPYGILLPLGIITSNRIQQRIRDEESGQRAEKDNGSS